MKLCIYLAAFILWYAACNKDHRNDETKVMVENKPVILSGSPVKLPGGPDVVTTQKPLADSIVAFAKTLIGVPYQYGSSDVSVGFDCSGFITYVFSHFGITVPRSSVEFTNLGEKIEVPASKPGDLILFTGTDAGNRVVGHMGIVTGNTDSLRFIHATSGKQSSVTISTLGKYYEERFVKLIRIL
jgi:cell wall-associated NlpC family hydrolase